MVKQYVTSRFDAPAEAMLKRGSLRNRIPDPGQTYRPSKIFPVLYTFHD